MINRLTIAIIIFLVVLIVMLIGQTKRTAMFKENFREAQLRINAIEDTVKTLEDSLVLEKIGRDSVKIALEKAKTEAEQAKAKIVVIERPLPIEREDTTTEGYIEFLEKDNKILVDITKAQGYAIKSLETVITNQDSVIASLERTEALQKEIIDQYKAKDIERLEQISLLESERKRMKRQRNGIGVGAGILLIIALL